jgi:uncharacterized protein (DUF924 family)
MSSPKGPQALAAEVRRKESEAAALRENLKRRKAQARGRQAVEDEAAIQSVLDFWFAPQGNAEHGTFRRAWFEKQPEFDGTCRTHFAGLLQDAATGKLDRWTETAEGALALVVLLDQLSRNIHRGTPGAFATDPQALALARRMVARGFDRVLDPVMRIFVYLPFEHAEDPVLQDESVRLMESLPEASWRAEVVRFAHAHRDVIARYGRFPHRNAILGRTSTPAETEYLALPGAGF